MKLFETSQIYNQDNTLGTARSKWTSNVNIDVIRETTSSQNNRSPKSRRTTKPPSITFKHAMNQSPSIPSLTTNGFNTVNGTRDFDQSTSRRGPMLSQRNNEMASTNADS